jgi:hypothetical protein
MRTLSWIIAWIAVAVWSLVAWAGHAFLGFAGDVVADNADVASDLVPVPPEGVELLSGLADTAAWLGQGAVVVVWAIGVLAILAVPAILGLLRRNRVPDPPRWYGTEPRRPETAGGTWPGPDMLRAPPPQSDRGSRLADRVRAIATRRDP